MTITRAPYIWPFTITHVRDVDSYKGTLDRGFNDRRDDVELRAYGINGQEITRSRTKNRGDAEVEQGYDQRDAFLQSIGVDPNTIPRKAVYQPIPHTDVLIETQRDEDGKYGRLLAVVHKDGVNINEAMRDIIGGVEFYDKKDYPADYPIRPSNHPIYERYHEVEGVVQLKPEYHYGL